MKKPYFLYIYKLKTPRSKSDYYLYDKSYAIRFNNCTMYLSGHLYNFIKSARHEYWTQDQNDILEKLNELLLRTDDYYIIDEYINEIYTYSDKNLSQFY